EKSHPETSAGVEVPTKTASGAEKRNHPRRRRSRYETATMRESEREGASDLGRSPATVQRPLTAIDEMQKPGWLERLSFPHQTRMTTGVHHGDTAPLMASTQMTRPI